MEFGLILKKLRTERNITQQQLADALFVDKTSVCKWEAGAYYPNQAVLISVADYFGVTLDYLFNREQMSALDETISESSPQLFDNAHVDRPEILELFDELTPELQEHAIAYMHGLADRAAIQKSGDVNVTIERSTRKRL